MKLAKKHQEAIFKAISNAAMRAYDEHCPEVGNNPPDTWDEDTRRRFDLITDVEMYISLAVKKVLES